MTHAIEVVQYTDPYCTWCWGSEPMLRHLEEAYGHRLSVRFVMGGLVEDSTTFSDPMNGIGGPDWLRPIADHWMEASQRHGMPVEVSTFLTTAFRSTWPSNIAYEAVKLQDKTLADRYLRRLREVAATEGGGLDEVERLADIAEAMGADRTRFLADFSGPAVDEFRRDRLECMERDVRGFPTFLLVVDGKERLARGWRSFEQLTALIDELAGEPVGRHQPAFSESNVFDFVVKHGSAAVREVSEVFEVSDDTAKAVLERLVENDRLEASRGGLLYRAVRVEVGPHRGSRV